MSSHRPSVMATRHLVVSGHYWASLAGHGILEAGGNAIDAGVAVGLAINVLESEMTGFAGVAPTLIRRAGDGQAVTFVGVGPWPQALSAEYFRTHFGGRIPPGILNTVVPAAPDIWLSALERFGTMSFGEVAAAAISFARDGFPMYPLMAEVLTEHLPEYQDLPSTAAIFLPQGRVPRVGERFVQRDLGATLQYLADEEAASRGGREAGLQAARRAFYEGDIARAIVAQQEEQGGFMTRDDLARFRAEIMPATEARFGEYALYGCGPWSQGPMILHAAQMLARFPLREMGHNTARYIHTVAEALKLAAADREAYFGDPAHIDVPLESILAEEFTNHRAANIGETAVPTMPAPGAIPGFDIPSWQPDPSSQPAPALDALETSYFCVVDREGNVFSATPSDPTISGEVVPGTGITTSMWGTRGHTDERHPARVGPGWRPRMSANPMLGILPGREMIPVGSPGSEVLGQAQLQVFLNMTVFGMDPQTAVEVPRFASYSWPASAIPHSYAPGQLNLEAAIDHSVGEELASFGHAVKWWPERTWRAGSVCTIRSDLESGVLNGGADPRRTAYAIG